ncbi:hypothetical protein M011DRAFT_101523 [Sporormia fimetaria CBS 119925]|uniref:Uncharacterized protein n=1 Tax=Sporormia fimetaria CBS 119925 TaxID=1340428 RepID=A0A6A6VMT1_9PLEO|nr:hypothetical protein M011DRAFT_101523 [Sporormia fimetaria CBS 119925]
MGSGCRSQVVRRRRGEAKGGAATRSSLTSGPGQSGRTGCCECVMYELNCTRGCRGCCGCPGYAEVGAWRGRGAGFRQAGRLQFTLAVLLSGRCCDGGVVETVSGPLCMPLLVGGRASESADGGQSWKSGVRISLPARCRTVRSRSWNGVEELGCGRCGLWTVCPRWRVRIGSSRVKDKLALQVPGFAGVDTGW